MGQAMCRRPPELKFFLFGLDAAGKTTLLYRLKTGETLAATIPTAGFNVETVALEGRASLTLWDTGGRCATRPLLRHFFPHTHGLAFVIDVAGDPDRLADALNELAIYSEEPALLGLPVAVLCNKCDLLHGTRNRDCAIVDAVRERIQAHERLAESLRGRPNRCFAVSAVTGSGLTEALDWLVLSALEFQRQEQLLASAAAGGEGKGLMSGSRLYRLAKSALIR